MGDRVRRFAEAMNDLRSANLVSIEGKLVSFVEDYFVSPSPRNTDDSDDDSSFWGSFFKKIYFLPQNQDRDVFVQQHNKARQKQKNKMLNLLQQVNIISLCPMCAFFNEVLYFY